jgi:hypothetical protein
MVGRPGVADADHPGSTRHNRGGGTGARRAPRWLNAGYPRLPQRRHALGVLDALTMIGSDEPRGPCGREVPRSPSPSEQLERLMERWAATTTTAADRPRCPTVNRAASSPTATR